MADLEHDSAATENAETAAPTAPRRRRAASRPAGPPAPVVVDPPAADAQPAEPAQKAAPRKRSRKATQPEVQPETELGSSVAPAAPTMSAAAEPPSDADSAADAAPAPAARRRTRKAASPLFSASEPDDAAGVRLDEPVAPVPLFFQAPVEAEAAPFDADEDDAATDRAAAPAATDAASDSDTSDVDDVDDVDDAEEDQPGSPRKRRRRGGRGRRRRPAGADEGSEEGSADDGEGSEQAEQSNDQAAGSDPAGAAGEGEDDDEESLSASSRRRRRRRRGGGGGGASEDGTVDDPDRTVVHVREPRDPREPREPRQRSTRGDGDEVTAVRGSTRLEAKKQRRREGRDAGRRRPPILSEAEFLSRREAVDRVMVVRQKADLTQIAVLEDNVLVEHYVASDSSATMVGNVYLGKVQNVLPSMEAAFIDIGRGRNAVLYAGEVNWDAAGLDGQPRRIEHVMKSGDSILVQVTKDPMGHKGSRLTSNVSLAGRFLVYVPDGSMSGISRKLPDTERSRLKAILKKIVPDEAGVIVRTAAEGATEEQLTRDVTRLQGQWDAIQKKAKTATAPDLLYGEPDLTVRVVRDLFNEDFAQLVVSGDEAWDVVDGYIGQVAPDLMDRARKHEGSKDVFAEHRIDEQIAKALDRKVYLPSGGSLVIDRTEAMTVVDVNTGKFVGKGSGNLEETVTRNNLEAAEEIVRQLRLRDIGGIIVIDFIDMVLESNRDLVLRRLTECLGRDRTKHQVAEVTSLGLVQMTRKRIGQGLLESFSEPCEHCHGRGITVHMEPVEARAGRGRHDQHDTVDKAERVARVAKVVKATQAAKAAAEAGEHGAAHAEPPVADAAATPGTSDSTEEAAPAKGARGGRTRSGRSKATQPAQLSQPAQELAIEAAPEVVAIEAAPRLAAIEAAAPVTELEPAKPPARRRRVAKKAAGAPPPADGPRPDASPSE